ncbi:unnamed protein product [Anisakis simplex]|uniref:HAP1 N-terminal domain-containing protein n=1 Tax=Anisakis simplex TaxID=6269 RepID=A0A0M3JHT0_ANISI|nr:unnamed protein product [Anisakis simplex]
MDRVLLENETLKQRVDELHGNAVELEALKKQLRLVQISRESAQESLFKVEAERDHLKESLERLTEENLAFKTTNKVEFEEFVLLDW